MPTSSVSSGQIQPGLIVSGGSAVDVLSGGTITGASILSGGSATIEVGGVDSGSTISAGGSELVFGSANGDTVAGLQTVSTGTTAGLVTNETVVSGGVVFLSIKTTSAANTTVDSGGQLNLSGAISATDTVLSGGTVDLESAKATLTGSLVFAGGGTLEVTGDTNAGAGDLAVISGFATGDVIDMTAATSVGAATGATLTTTISGGNTIATVSGGGASDSYIFSGTTIGASLTLIGDGAGGREITVATVISGTASVGSGETQSNLIVTNGGSLTVEAGGTMVSASVLVGGSAIIQAGGVDSGSVISGGETVAGSATGDSVFGAQTVSGGTAVVSNETVQSGGNVTLAVSGATATGTTVLNGGTLSVSGTADNTTISGGTVKLETSQATLGGSFTFNGPGTLDIAAVSNTGFGDQAVISGFANGDVINLTAFGSGATLSTTTSGSNTIATVTSGGASETLTFAGSLAAGLSLTNSGGSEQISYVNPIATLTAFTAGDLVLSVYGDGAGTGSYTDNQAAPITLEEITRSGAIVGELVLPQTTTVANGTTAYAISGEYGSSSEGTLQLSEDGQSLVIAGYGVNAIAFNTGGAAAYGNAALGQSTSLLTTSFIPVARVIADISFNGSIDTSTALYNVFDTNNPRSVTTVDGTTFYIAGQGVKGDATQGVFVASDGASSGTAIDTSTDARTAVIINGVLYISRDSTQGDGGQISTYGATLPTSATPASVLPGINGQITLTAAQANGINDADVGASINLSPENYFLANATTLYVADGGNPKAGGLGDGGLQKWVLTGGTWTLAYTLTSGLNLMPDTATDGSSGLIGLTGTVLADGSVQLYATNETLSDLDQTYLYGITDTLSATTLPTSESFTVLETAAPDTIIRGVSFAPTSSSSLPEVSTPISVASGVTSAGLSVTGGGSITVLSGGTITGTTLLSGGSATISAGGVDSGTFIAHGASELVLGSASLDTIDGTQIVSNGTAVVSGETVENGGALDLFLKNAIASGTTVMAGGTLNISGNAFAVDTVISGGAVILESAKAVLSGTLDFVGNGGTVEVVSSTTNAGFGDLAVISGFGATDIIDERVMGAGTTLSTALSGGNVVATLTSGSVVETFTFAGSGGVTGSAYMSGLALTTDGSSGVELTYTPPAPVVITVSSGVTSSGLSLGSGSTINVLSGGTISATTVLSGGSAVIAAGGVDSGSTVMAGGFELVSGSATGDQIFGIQLVSGASPTATVSNETVFNGGTVELFLKPDTGTNITVSSGGALLLSGNVTAIDTVLEAGALMELQSPKATLGGSLTFSGAATLAFTDIISSGFGDFAVISGFSAGDVIDETLISSSVATLTTAISGGNTIATISGAAFPELFIFAGTTIGADLRLVSDGGSGVELIDAACFGTGTLITTEAGPRAIETLKVGDIVRTAAGEAKPIRWIGYRSVDLQRHPRPHDVMPVRVQAHAIAPGCPSRDLLLSPDHAVFLEDVLIPVRYLLNGASIAQESAERITWWHVELDAHDVILAEGMPTESYLDTGNRGAFANAGPGHVIQAHPDFSRGVWAAEACAPLVITGPALRQAREALLARLPELGHIVTTDPDLRFEAGGAVLQPQLFGEWICLVTPDETGELRLRSNTVQPAALESLGDDWRTLGIAMVALRIDGEPVALDAPLFASGWLSAEDGLRWSTGDAVLHVPPSSVVEIRIARFQRYAVAAAGQTAQLGEMPADRAKVAA